MLSALKMFSQMIAYKYIRGIFSVHNLSAAVCTLSLFTKGKWIIQRIEVHFLNILFVFWFADKLVDGQVLQGLLFKILVTNIVLYAHLPKGRER